MRAECFAACFALFALCVTGASFSYDQTSTTYGPSAWSSMTSTQCSSTTAPSPIDLKLDIALAPSSQSQFMGPLDVLKYEAVPRTITASNDGANLYFEFGSDLRYSYIKDPTDSRVVTMYQLSMMRFHSPSEHTFGGGHYDGELQIHWTASSAYPRSSGDKAVLVAVIPVVSNILGGNAELEALLNLASVIPTNAALSSTVNSTTLSQEPNSNPSAFRISNLIPPKPTYVTYDGALSNPPCTRNYRYVVFTTPTRINLRMLTWFRRQLGYTMTPDANGVLTGNYRPVQSSSATLRFYREMGDTSLFSVHSTGKGNSASAKTYSIASLVISGGCIFALIMAIASIASLIQRVENAVTELNPSASGPSGSGANNTHKGPEGEKEPMSNSVNTKKTQ